MGNLNNLYLEEIVNLLQYLGLTILVLWLLWALYVLIMGFYRAYLNKRLTTKTKILAFPFLAIGATLDSFIHYTLATVLFLDPPRLKEFLLTTRLSRYVKEGHGWRFRVARFICDKLLDVFDPTGDHC